MVRIRWAAFAVALLLAVTASAAVAPAGAQSDGPVGYYGDAETEDGTPIPNGTTLVAVANGNVQDRIDISPSGQYGTEDPTGPKLFVDTDQTVSFYIEKPDGTQIEALTTADPTQAEGAERLDITFPAGSVASAPYFSVSNLQPADGTAVEGETIDVSATVSNSVDSGTQSITFAVDGETRASKDVSLGTDESTTVNFSLDTTDIGTGSHTYTIASDNESKSETLTVAEEYVDFTLSSFEPVDTTVVSGEAVDISAAVTNEGNTEGTQTVSADLDGATVDSQEVTLGAGNQTTVSFTLETANVSAGSHTHAIATADDSQSGTLTIEDRVPATFTVSELSPTERTVTAGTTVDVSATITNVGERSGTQQVRLTVGESQVDNRTLTLDSSESAGVTLAVDTSTLGPGSYTHSIETANDSQSGTLTVDQSGTARFTVSELSPADTTVERGTAVDIQARITNEGSTAGTQQVRLTVDGSQVDSQSVSLPAGDDTVVSFESVDTGPFTTGTHTHTAATENDSHTGTITVTDTSETTQGPSDGTETTAGTTEPTEVPGNGTAAPTTANNESSDGGGGGLLPTGLIQTLLLYVALPLALIYGGLKALAIYLGY